VEALAQALADAGGIAAPRERGGRLRTLLAAELERGADELGRARSGYPAPVLVAIATAPGDGGLIGVAPVAPALRADPDAVPERAWLLTAALVGALVEAGAGAGLEAGHLGPGALALRLRGDGADPELAALAFEEQVAPVDRLRAGALALPAHVLADATGFKPPIGAAHPLLIAAHVARLGGVPADPRSTEEHEDAVLALLESEAPAVSRPHDDPEPARRVARRILQRLDGMGKWGGYHTEFAHLARGFAGNDRALAEAVGEALLASGLLSEKPSVGQRHVFLNPRRAGAIHALIERGDVPEELVLP
jgi:hypothetical protein